MGSLPSAALILFIARRKHRLTEYPKMREQFSCDVTMVVADLANSNDLKRVQDLFETRQDITVLVNNAGVGALGPTAKVKPSDLENLVKVNVLALTMLSVAALSAFRARGSGLLVNIASVIALGPSPTAAGYSGSKAYVLNFSRSLEQEYAETDVTIQTILPGPVRSEFFESSGAKPAFPDELYMTADMLAETALRAYDMKESVTFPTLPDTTLWVEFEGARKKFYKMVLTTGKPAQRYGM